MLTSTQAAGLSTLELVEALEAEGTVVALEAAARLRKSYENTMMWRDNGQRNL